MMRSSAVLIASMAATAAAYDAASYRVAVYDVSDVPMVRTVMDVRTSDGKATLNPADFRLLEDGSQTVAAGKAIQFRETNLGAALIVLLDASPSMKGRPLEAIRQGLAQLVSRKREQDRVAVLSFASDFRWEARWDASPATVESAFRDLQARGNRTRLYDAVGAAFDEFDAEAARDSKFPLRRAILLLSDGHDEGSGSTLQTQVRRLADSRIRLDAVGLARSPLWLASLQTLADAGFGSFRSVANPEALTALLERGIDVLLQTPVLEFRAERLTADGLSHRTGVMHATGNWRDTATVKMPEYVFYKDQRVWIASAAAALALILAGIIVARRPAPAVPPVAPAPPTAPAPRTPTMAEPQSAPRSATVVEPAAPAVPAYTSAAAPARAATVLAPGTAGTFSLAAVSGPAAGQRVDLGAAEFWIGSASNNHLCLAVDPAVSGNHACIRREGSVYRLYDNGSLNNTWVNGKPVGASAVLLQAGDRIGIGQSEFLFQ